MIDSFREARSLAIAHIGISHKSSGKVTDYLHRKGVQDEICVQAVNSLMQDGYIDDLRIARAMIQTRKGRKAEGRRSLQQRLYRAGISSESISEAFKFMPDDETSILELFEEKIAPDLNKLIVMESFDPETWMNKTFRFLLSRGYSSSLAMDTLRKTIRDVE